MKRSTAERKADRRNFSSQVLLDRKHRTSRMSLPQASRSPIILQRQITQLRLLSKSALGTEFFTR